LPRDITAPSTNNQLVSIIYLSPVANLFLKFRIKLLIYLVPDRIKDQRNRKYLPLWSLSKSFILLANSA
ncbi:hypothetical protein LMB37_03435, partial [Limosilactobacillus reuteri]|uniref:hypothetical protein n=1 Tax=Limosilactobacillus reuteri TaxID=1598 RepID=UPI001E3F904B